VNQVLAQAERAFERPTTRRRQEDAREQKIARLEARLSNKNEVIAASVQEHVQLKKELGEELKDQWVPHDTRDEVVDYVKRWAVRTELPKTKLIAWLGVGTSKFYTRQERYGQANEHNGQVPRDFWLEDWEKRAILDLHDRHPLDGYRRLTFIVARRRCDHRYSRRYPRSAPAASIAR
jgi:hypothetical protein